LLLSGHSTSQEMILEKRHLIRVQFFRGKGVSRSLARRPRQRKAVHGKEAASCHPHRAGKRARRQTRKCRSRNRASWVRPPGLSSGGVRRASQACVVRGAGYALRWRRRGRPTVPVGGHWPMSAISMSLAPGMSSAVRRPPLGSMRVSSRPWITRAGTFRAFSAPAREPARSMAPSWRPAPAG
jgi:hypothetical protein